MTFAKNLTSKLKRLALKLSWGIWIGLWILALVCLLIGFVINDGAFLIVFVTLPSFIGGCIGGISHWLIKRGDSRTDKLSVFGYYIGVFLLLVIIGLVLFQPF